MNLTGKIALVTGAGRGIGQGCAVELARAGADVVANDRPGGQDLPKTVESIRALGRKCWAIEADVFSRSGCEQLVSQTVSQAGRIDILVSNPARGLRNSFLECPPEQFDEVVRGTLTAGFHMGQLVARAMVARGRGGKLVFISSVVAEMPHAQCAAYNAAKAGLNKLAATIAIELSPHRINVNVIEPGWTDTPGERITFGDEAVNQGGARVPWGRLGTPADIGRAAAFLASDDAEYITGAVLLVDGGYRFKDQCLKS